MRWLSVLLTAPPDPTPIETCSGWWARHLVVTRGEPLITLDQAMLGGFAADRLGYAFASGLQAALRALVPDLPHDRVVSLGITERGGGHPLAIETRLDSLGGHRFRITGEKCWATLAGQASVLVVATSLGVGEGGQNRIRMVRVDTSLPGVACSPMPPMPFAPEVLHHRITLDSVVVHEEDLLPGDGFHGYVRPFRTVEDLHVYAAACAYAVREVRLHGLPRALAERFAGILVALRGLAAEAPSAPQVHLALAGVLELARGAFDDLSNAWQNTGAPAYDRWKRDRPLLAVASNARARRLERAWKRPTSD